MDGAGKSTIRGKDLVGGVMVMPMGLDAAIKKRTSGEFKMEQKSGSMSFSNAQQSESTSIQKESRQLSSFQEESTESFGGNQMQQKAFQSSVDSMKSSFSSMQSSQVSQSSSSFQSSSSSKMSMSSSQTMSSVTSAKTVSSSSFKSGFSQEAQISSSDWDSQQIIQNQNQEIKQDNLKTQIVSAITDLEGDRDLADFGRENKTIDLMSPPQAKSPTPKQQTPFTPTKQDPFSPAKQDMFSPPPLERYEPPQQQQQQAEVAPQQVQPEPAPLSNGHGQPGAAPTRNAQNGFQNGFTEFVSSSTSKNMEMQQIEEFSQSTRVNGGYQETGSVQESNSSNSLLQKIMTPASVEYDTGSMKKKDPKKMFTDSSFYNSKYHPTIQDQVEMAHKLSAAMFSEQGKGTKGARMYLTRMENSGGFGDDVPKHDNVPNMKLVMNPEGKVHLWDDLPEDQRPDLSQVAVHAAPNLSLPEVADPVAESLNAGIGKGEKCFYRPSTFVSAYRQVFDQNRGVFGTQAVLKSPESPAVTSKHTHAANVNKTPFHSKQSEAPKMFGDHSKDNKIVSVPNSPQASPRRQTTISKESENENIKVRKNINENQRTVNLKRHKSFTEDPKNSSERKPKYFAEPNIGAIKPSDVLKTPYLLPTVYPKNSPNSFNNFPQITSTSMVAKTKALFEEKDKSDGFVPLGKSRTFSCFPTDIGEKESSGSVCPLTPSVPQRNSSRSVIASYKSMNSNMNSCGVESRTSSPLPERRIPMRNFF